MATVCKDEIWAGACVRKIRGQGDIEDNDPDCEYRPAKNAVWHACLVEIEIDEDDIEDRVPEYPEFFLCGLPLKRSVFFGDDGESKEDITKKITCPKCIKFLHEAK